MKLFIYSTILTLSMWAHSGIANNFIPSDSVKKNKFNFIFDGRRSFISRSPVSIGGFRIGIQHLNQWRAGLGFYGLNTTILRDVVINQGTLAERTVSARLEFGYLSIYYERILYKTDKWEVSLPFQLGAGDVRFTYLEEDSNKVVAVNKRSVVLAEPSLMAEYRFLKWAGLGVGIGMRKMLITNELLEDNFNAPIYLIKLKIHFGELYKGLRERRREKKGKRSDTQISEGPDD